MQRLTDAVDVEMPVRGAGEEAGRVLGKNFRHGLLPLEARITPLTCRGEFEYRRVQIGHDEPAAQNDESPSTLRSTGFPIWLRGQDLNL
ncbi:hypothetical protein FP568_17915 [Pandoraea pnomenusa]|nr:hypothetical protein FP568_17915 [Pandoraea pnomenusa]